MRLSVAWFAAEMEKRLDANANKGGWENCAVEWLLARMVQEVGEALIACHDEGIASEQLRRELADVADFAMMAAQMSAVAAEDAHVPDEYE